ncbi:uncharacterized protein LOC128603594 [Ictalurus furcatus]|uniref:uncharacterized protein LOC128603594 n=1 Tax=Ictalurus furcatus TaxID=66913 RepID=UPI002350861C|nr:uncharacterized protein LOC128603594 [Ictalurus furcatus]
MAWSNISYRSGDAHHLSELRLVLLGCRTAGKSSSGNTILGSEEFDLRGSAQCVKRQGEVAGRKITVVEVPGWQRDKSVTQALKQEIVLSVSMCPPGPHAVLLVMRLDFKSWESEKNALRGCMKLLTQRVWSHSIVLFTIGDWIRDQTIEQYIECKGKALQWLVEHCGNRYHVFNNNSRNDNTQVTELLEKIEKMVAGNGGGHLEIDTKILQEVKERKTAEEDRSKERRMKVSNQRKFFRKHWFAIDHLSEVRIVLLGYRNAGKSSSGNTILGNDTFEFNQRDKCVKRQGKVAGRMITVIEAPGFLRSYSTESLKEEFELSVSMCPPGPHAVLLVMCLDFKFREKQRKALVRYLDLLGERVWSHIIILFTYGDFLGDTTIERHIESEGTALQWLVEKCGNRYHVFNNKNRRDNTQVRELLEKIEEMVSVNGDCFRDMNFEAWRRRSGKEAPTIYFRRPLPEVQVVQFQSSTGIPRLQWASGFNPELNYFTAVNQGLLRSPPTSQKHDSADTELLIRKLVKSRSEENRILCLPAGEFMCKSTDLVFKLEEQGSVLYRIVSWDHRFFGGLHQMEFAGPLYSIDCWEDSIRHLHLPHCEIRKDVVKLTVAHMTGGNVEIIQPLKVTDTHVIIDIQRLSLFGLLKSLLFPAYPIRAQVLLFYNNRMRKLHIHLLPGNVPVDEVQKRHDTHTYILTSSKCQLTPGKIYRPCCKTTDCDYVSQPEDETFDCDYGPNFHPTFEVLFNTEVNKVTLSLLDETCQVVWKPRMVLLTGTERARMDRTGAEFVDKHRETLIQRVSSVMEIADCLKSKNMIRDEMYYNIKEESTSYKQMRLLYRSLDTGGRAVKEEFCKILREKEPFLVNDLESGSSLD